MATKCTECKKPIEAQHGKISDGTEHGMVRHYSNSTGISLPGGPCVGWGGLDMSIVTAAPTVIITGP